MPEEKDKIKKLYDTFVSDGYDMESEEDFRKNLLDSAKRKAAYDALVKDGYDMEPFEEFESNIGFGKEQTSSQQSGNSASGTVEEPISPANEQTWQPTEKEKVAMLTETDRIMNDVKSHTQTFNERIDNMQEYGINPGLQTKEGKMIFNPESGKLEKTFLTPAGNRYYSKSLADMESFQYRQAADMSIGGQLRKANLRLQELKAKQAERASEVHKEWAEETENNKAPLAAILGAATYMPRQQSDKENRALSVAIRETEELIKNLEEQKDRENGVDVGFWRGFGRTMGDVRTWDFGMGDMRDAFTMMNADELKKENATEGEREAHDAMMGAIHEKQQAEERYSGNADFWNRAGVMTGYMPSFMLDFVLTGGGFNGLSSFSKGSTRLATKVIGKETAEKMAQQGFKSYIKENGAKGLGRYATDWTIKALGTTADDLLVRAPLMANTVQAGKTTTDIIDRKLGDVVVDENGNYDFSNDKTWGDAIWQSEANAIIENYSEMFGAHLDPVFTLGNMSKLANVVGAKRIGAVLSKADASALNGIMGQTHQMFNKMGVSDYVGEVSEEYYGQLWRTMLNLDDAYQQNPDGTRTNLFASDQFHGDIWGGMALSMGLMGAGKHTLSAANYASMKHGVNKADAKVNELLGKEVWEPLKAMLDLTTNESIGEVVELIAGDKDFTINEKAAVLDYMERSLNLRGFNLASMAQSRGGNRNESVQQANDSYLDGYNIISSQEMNDAKNMYEYQRARVADLVDESMFAMIEENPIAALEFVNGNEQWNDEDKVSVIDYINAKQVYNGMIQRVRDDIDGRIEQSNSIIDARVNRNTGMIQGATMKQDERKVYVISGKLVPYDDGSGVSVTDSDNSIIIRDSETGALEQVSPDAVLSLDESQDPNEQKELAEQAIVEQFAREAADKIDGKVTFNSGDAYTITGQDGSQMQVQVIANEDGIVDNGDGTVNVSDGVNIFPLAKETIQQQADAANLARVAQFEQQRTIENAEWKQEMQEAERPQYALNDIVSLTDENGVTVRGNITADVDADGKYEVFTEAPINGKRVNLFTRDELDNMLLEHNGVAFERPAENESNNGAENIPENDNNAPQNIPAMQRIPKDEQGNPLYEQADSDTAWDAIVEQTEGDEDMAQTVADGMVADKEEALKKLEKAKSKGGNSIAEKIASEKERKAAIDAAYTITPAQYTTKRGKVLDMHLVKFNNELRDTVRKHTTMFAKQLKGWWDKEKQGFMMRSKEDAERLAEYATDAQSQPPLSLSDLSEVNDGNVQFAESQLLETSKQEEKQEYSPVWQYSVSVDKKTGLTTLKRDDVSGPIPIGDGRFNYTANSPEEMLEIVRNPKNFNQELRDAVETILENKVKIREIVRTEKAEATEQESKPENNPSGNRLVTDERYAELRERMRKKLLGQMNMGIDPEILAIGTEMAVYHLEKGARKFTEYATAMVADLGDSIRPYLKAFYNGARDLPEVAENGLDADMTPYDEVQQFDVTNFDKKSIDALATAETVTRETEVEQEAEIAQERIKKSRPARKKNEKKAVISQQSNELGLFDALTDNNKNSEHGLQRTDAERSERVPAKGYRHEQGLSRGTETGSESEQQAGRGTDNEGERTGDAVDRTVRPRLSDSLNERSIEGKRKKEIENNRKLADELKGVTLHLNDKLGGEHEISGIVYYELANVFHCNDNISGPFQATRKELDAILKVARKNDGRNTFTPKNTHNNHSERGKDHAPTSVDARIEANIKAIELAKQLLENGEQATEKQMQTLRKFSGWGGLGKAFSEGAYYAPNPTQKKLRELLGEKAYQEAVMSANSAYYTPAYVVDTLWDIAEKMGFEGGNILEGSAGIGNILGQMPAHISERSDIHAIEIDGTSGGILSLLYPDAKVDIQGFEQTRIPNGSIDLAITNVPFVTGLRVNDTTGDKDLSKKFHNIHDFCIAKNVRKLREGGLGIFITSNGTLDNSKKLRDWIVNEGGSDFVGAFRMHNKTFGGTGVTSDIVVIRKRVNGQKSAHVIDVSDVSGERMAEYDTGETRKVKGKETPVIKQLSMDYNRYFIEHPENMAGEMHFAFEKGDTFRPTSKGLYPAQDKKQEQMLSEFVHSFKAEEFGERNAGPVTDVMPDKKIGEIFIRDGKLFINSTASAQPLEVNANKVKGHTKVECFEAYTAIKEALAEVLSYQTENESDEGLKPLLDKLNKAYDDFVGTYGHFNKNTAIAFLRNDVDYANVFALEKFEETADEKGNRIQKFEKTDVFSKRVVEKDKEPTPANVKDGIIASIFKFGRVDIPYIAEQLGTGIEDVKKEIIESGYGFEDPVSRQMEASYQYLSGNIREKLRQAEENNENGEFDRNIKALQEVMPMEIPAHLIDFTLGSSWIDPKLYEDFVKERTEVDVRFTAVGGTWFMKEPYFTNYEKNRAMGVTSEMLGRTIMGHTLIEAAIQNRSITVSTTKKHYDGTTETITDKEATQACAAKIDEIRQDFKDWARQKMQSDPEMSERMERIYNDMFNNFVPMSIPDEFVPEYFGGASHKFKMRPHQGRAIVRGTQQPLLLAHEVGTGKTFTLISTAMEMRRLGTARKPMIVVQNATVGQFVASAKELYPNAKILTLEEADRSAEGRKNFYAKIRYNDWDMIVVPQSTFEFIPDSEEREMTFVQDKIEEKMLILEQMKEEDPDGKNMITRQAEREIELLEEQLAGLADNASKKRTANDEKKRAVALQNAEVKAMEMLDRRTDDVENFDDMGIDALLVDEAHEYKHLGFATAMQRGVKGVDPSYSKKSQGVFLKTQAVLEKNNGRNVIFATGTPISNTAAEIWTFMRYLMPADTMKEYGIYYFDDFVRNFGNIQQMLEFTTSGKFKENNRFAGYVNLPELVRIWSGVSDTVLTKEAGGVKDKIPEMEGGKAQDLYLPQTRALRSIMKFVKSELEHYEQMSGKEKKENSHIPLTMYGIAKAAAVDARLVQSDAEDDQNSKTNEAVRQTLRSLKETADYKGTVAIFADNYQNKQSGFNLYDDIRNKLIAEGVPADEIVVMRSGMTVKKKLEIFEKVNRGEVRVILGSTFTLGTGVNIQERLHTLIHLDAPNRPMDYTQRNGRILRQGNLHKDMNKPVRILRFGVEDSLDVTAYQRLKTKGAIADSIMNGKQMMNNSMTNRVLEEEEDVFGDTVAQLSGSEYAMLKNNAEKNVRKYASRKKQWETDQTYIHNAKPRLKAFIKDAEKRIEDNGRYLEAVRSSFPDGQFKEIVIGKHRFTSVDTMDDFFKEYNKSVLAEMKQMKDGEISGEQKRELIIQIGDFSFVVTTKLARKTMSDGATLFNDVERRMTYSCLELGIEEDVPVRQNLLRNAVEDITDNVITGKDFAEILSAGERSKKHNEAELKELLSREGKPFEYEEELAQAKVQLEEYAELMKKELEEKEAKYAEMDATVETANNISTSEEDDELKREGDGAYTDDEVSYENDPTAKQLSQSRRTAKQRREFARRERQRMAERVESLAEKLHLDNVEVVTDASVLDGKKQRAKGFYSKSTGKITIVIPNHTSTFDVEQTLLHEAVAHYGLRQLFGEHFDTFLDNVFNNADENIRRHIVDMAAKNGWDFHKATEEYLASLAEDTEFENINASWWQQIKDFFLNMLHKIGFEDFRGVTLSDNELRYILWRSYENLAEPGRYRNILGEAADVAKQYELKVGNYAVSDPHHQTVAESDDALYRTGDPEIHERELARDRYERRVKSGMFQSQEALQDSMLGLKEAMTAILGKETNIEDVDGFENAYLGENRLSSVNKAEADAFAHTLFKPMLDEVAKLARTEAEREELTDYMMAKHGLERNTYMRNEAINNGATDADQTDYAGLTALTGMDNVTDAETEAQIMVNDYEQTHDTTDLWKKVNAASKAILSKSYECGMMSKATFDKISDMYDFYIPLRGFDEKTSSEAYAYLTHKQSAFNAPIKKAEGRRSKADDPFANLQSMAEGAIMQGNRNKLVKQRFLNFALNHSSDLVSVSDIWVEYDTVADEWKPVFPDNIDSTDTPEVVERKMLDFETKMESLAQQYPDRYKHGKDTVNIPYRIVESRDMRQHQIVVKRGGRDYVITINGNPRAAQALNGQTNPDNDMSGAIGAILRAGENINRQLSAFYTTRNPDFIVSNFMRDMLYTNTMTWIRESPNYALRFHRNYMYANPVRIKQLLAKHRKGTLDMSNKTEAMFHQFMMNGGETGYANIRDIEQHKNDIRRGLKKSNGKIPVKKAWELLGERFDEYNRAVENCARFAAFMTSREMGRSIDRAIYDAKEISVNFNKKGSGAKFYDSTGQTKAGNASALVSGLGRSGYVFWNAAIQGTANFGRQMKRHPAKAFTGIAAMFLLGAIVAYLGGDDDDDDDKNAYYNLPEYVRRSNILFRAGNSWVSIPLPVEYRAVYGMGELMISVLNGKEHLTGEEIAEAITGQVTQILPIDFLEGGGGLNAFVPSAYKPLWEAYVAEKSWTGMPLYKDTPYNKDMPEWTKAYKSANKYIVGLANAMNEATGGDPYTKGTIDFNPAKIEYMLNGYFGGVFGTIDKLSKTAETITDNREYDPRSFLLVNRLVKAGDERTEYRAVNNEYFRLKEEHDRLKSRLKHYEEDTDNDIFDYAEKIDFLYNSPEYERYEIFEDYRRDIDDLYNELNDTVDDEERKNIEAELNELKKEMIEEMNKTRK